MTAEFRFTDETGFKETKLVNILPRHEYPEIDFFSDLDFKRPSINILQYSVSLALVDAAPTRARAKIITNLLLASPALVDAVPTRARARRVFDDL